jgi:DNA-binding NtrC family response regulator
LRDRGNDVELLAHYFARLVAAGLNRPVPRFDDKVLDLFRAYSWPGNVRELRNVIENMVLLGESNELQIEDVPAEVRRQANPVAALALEPSSSASPKLKQNERAAIESALAKSDGKLTAAAKLLGIARATLYRKLAHYGINRSVRNGRVNSRGE